MSDVSIESKVDLKPILEVMIFASDEPLSVKTLKTIFEESEVDGQRIEVEADEIRAHIKNLNQEYERENRSYRIIEIAEGYQFSTLPKLSGWVGKVYKEKTKRRLSQSAIESLAIIAYKQPVSKPDLEFIRGVNCDYVLKTLLEKNLIAITGRAATPGRPLLYGTTKDFLRHFGLGSLGDLPKPREIEELLGETEMEVEKKLLEEQKLLEEGEEVERIEKPKETGPRFKKPQIPVKKDRDDQQSLSLAGVKSTNPLDQDDSSIEKSQSEIREREKDQEHEKIEIIKPIGVAEGKRQNEIESEEESLEIKKIKHVKKSSPSVVSNENVDNGSEQAKETLKWDQIPDQTEEERRSETRTIGGPSLEQIHDAAQQERERGWSRFRNKVAELFKRLFG